MKAMGLIQLQQSPITCDFFAAQQFQRNRRMSKTKNLLSWQTMNAIDLLGRCNPRSDRLGHIEICPSSLFIKNKNLFYWQSEYAPYLMCQSQRRIVFPFFKKDNSFSAYINLFGLIFLCQLMTRSQFFNSSIHC